jgi:hypothetical protein
MQTGRLTYWQAESLVVKNGEGSAYTVGKLTYENRQAYLVAERESCSADMERDLLYCR